MNVHELFGHRGYIYEKVGFDFPSKNGNDLTLTIDWHAQKIAEKLMHAGVDAEGKTPLRGAFVLLNADTGEILSLVSSPTYDLEQMVPKIPQKVWDKLNNDPAKPLVNRAISRFTPGSILKPLIGLALQSNHVRPEESVFCDGKTYVSKARIKCLGHHGNIGLLEAVKHSCNVYFIEQGQEIGLEKISKLLRSAGLGEKTGITLPNVESSGFCPTRENVYDRFKHKWNAFDTALLSIGQGKIEITPLQAANYAAAIANGGTLWTPYLLKEVRTPYGAQLFKGKPKRKGKLDATTRQIQYIQEGMWRVVNQGTADKAKNNFMTIFGKTGTAERSIDKTYTPEEADLMISKVAKRTGVSEQTIRYKLRNNGRIDIGNRPETCAISKKKSKEGIVTYRYQRHWNNTRFIGFGSYQGTRYSFAIFVEHGKYGSATCAPIAGQFFEEWLRTKQVTDD